MSKIKPQDHPDYVGGWVWTKLELDWINGRIGTLEAALFQAQEAAKDLEARLTKTEGWLNEAVWNYGELKREQLANSEETSSSPVEDWEAIAADQALTIALLKSEAAAQPAPAQPVQEPVAYRSRMRNRDGQVITGWVVHTDTSENPDPRIEIEPLYTTPPVQPAPVQEPDLTEIPMIMTCTKCGAFGEATLTLETQPAQKPVNVTSKMVQAFLYAAGRHFPWGGSDPAIEDGIKAALEAMPTPPAAQRQWVPVTKELLSAQHPWLYESMWIAMKDGSVMTGYYAWMQGRYPDRFLVGDCASLWAFEATHVMPMNQPKHPAKLKEQ